MDTRMSGVETPLVWWEKGTNTEPIIGMDNFDKLGLQLFQLATNGTKLHNSARRNQVKRKTKRDEGKPNIDNRETAKGEEAHILEQLRLKVKVKINNLFQVNKTFKDFEYDVQFKPQMDINQKTSEEYLLGKSDPSAKGRVIRAGKASE